MKLINHSMGAQMMIKTLELFMFGLLLIFNGSIAAADQIPIFIFTSSYIHITLFQVSFIASSTEEEVCYFCT
jgi:hypothetical protein